MPHHANLAEAFDLQYWNHRQRLRLIANDILEAELSLAREPVRIGVGRAR